MPRLKNKTVTVNTDTGEVIETAKYYSIKTKNSEHFFSVFINSVGKLYDLKNVSDYKVIIELCCRADFNTGVVHISSHHRLEMLTKLGLTTQNFSNSISRLKKLRLIAGEKGTFTINPEIFWIGDRDKRAEMLKSTEFQIAFIIKETE